MKLKRSIGIILLLAVTALLAAIIFFCVLPKEVPVISSAFPSMGTLAKVSVYTSEEDLTLAFTLCKERFEKVEKLCSLYDPESELSRINAQAAHAPVVCSPEMWTLLMRSRQAYRESGGNFDISVKPLMDLWGFYRKKERAPSDEEIVQVMKKVGFDKLIFNEKERSILFSVPGMALDMGGIAKGYAADMAAADIVAAGVRSVVVDIGGNLRMLPEPPPGKNFYTVGIRNPSGKGKILPGLLKVAPGMAVSTSGDYERFVIYQGKRYGHIISPVSGRPTAVSAVTVVASKALDADIFSTVCCLGGRNIARKLQDKFPEITIRFAR